MSYDKILSNISNLFAGNDSGLYSFTGLIFIYSSCGARSDSEVAPGFFC